MIIGSRRIVSSLVLVVLSLLLPPANAYAAVSFGAPTQYPVTGFLRSIAVGEFNSDSNTDVVAVKDGGSMALLLGNGNGTLGTATNIPMVGATSNSVLTGDFTGDGKHDAVVANVTTDTVSLFTGNGAGGFSGRTEFNVGTGPWSMCSGKFNNDAHTDLATANYTSNSVSILLGNGAGGFAPAVHYPIPPVMLGGDQPQGMVTGDFNSDAKLDVVVWLDGPSVALICYGDGNGGIASSADALNSIDGQVYASAQFNGDLATDVVQGEGDTLYVSFGNGSGNFPPTPSALGVSQFISSAAVGDVDGDSRADLIAGSTPSDNVSVFISNGLGQFTNGGSYSAGSGPVDICIVDMNSDGKNDIVTANANNSRVAILLNQSTPASASDWEIFY